MDKNDLVKYYSRLYHMASDGSWASIKRHGLLSTRALLDLWEVADPSRRRLLAEHRPASVNIEHAEHGQAVVRDQIPMTDEGLRRSLSDFTPEEWYRHLNSRVFLWATKRRLGTMLNARAYRDQIHTVITVDTERLLAMHEQDIRLSHMNSGATKPVPHPRGKETFRRIKDFPFEERRRRYGTANALAEVTVQPGIKNMTDVTVRVVRQTGDQELEVIWNNSNMC